MSLLMGTAVLHRDTRQDDVMQNDRDDFHTLDRSNIIGRHQGQDMNGI